jgi:hypothetical protein
MHDIYFLQFLTDINVGFESRRVVIACTYNILAKLLTIAAYIVT